MSKFNNLAKIAEEEHAECILCGFSDHYEDMVNQYGHWFHRECQLDLEDAFKIKEEFDQQGDPDR